MLILLSPAKKLLKDPKPYLERETSQPLFPKQTKILVEVMRTKSVENIAALMDLSTDLATLNFERYQDFVFEKDSPRAYPAIFLFQGDVYQGLRAGSWSQDTITYAQSHLRILSGLYGLLNPLDTIQPYRLEMGVRLENPAGNSLYAFWQDAIVHALNQQLALQQNPVVVNLASTEYFKAVNEKKLNYPVLTINFYEQKNNQLKMIGVHAKKARGLMAKFLMQNQIDDVEGIKKFNELGYEFHPATSSEKHFDFIRSSSL